MGGPLVLRVMPNPDAAVRETIVQRAVADQGYPTPTGRGRRRRRGPWRSVHGDGASRRCSTARRVSIGRLLLRRCRRRCGGSRTDEQWLSCSCTTLDPQPVIDSLDAAGVDIGALGVDARLDEIREAAARRLAGFDGVLSGSTTAARRWAGGDLPRRHPPLQHAGDARRIVQRARLDQRQPVPARVRRRVHCGVVAVRAAGSSADRPSPVGAITASLSRRFVDAYRRLSPPINLDVVEWFETLQYGALRRCRCDLADRHPIVGAKHPFRIAAPAMIRQLTMITETKIELPPTG